MGPNLLRVNVKIAKFIFLLFAIFASCTANGQKGVVMTIHITNKHPDLLADTGMKVWSKGNLIKTVFLSTGKVFYLHKEPELPLLLDTVVEKSSDTGSTIHTQYIKNLKTGESLDISYVKGKYVIWKRIEGNQKSMVDSTKKIFLNDERVIAGHVCKKVILENNYTKNRDTIYAAMDIKNVRNPFFPSLKLFPMFFTDRESVFEVTEISIIPLEDKIFTIPQNSIIFTSFIEWVTFIRTVSATGHPNN